jgi:hypothetical protein
MQGLFVNGRRPRSKAEVKRVAAATPERLRVEATSYFGNEWEGYADKLPVGLVVRFVGPEPSTSRKFYGTLTRLSDGRLRVA